MLLLLIIIFTVLYYYTLLVMDDYLTKCVKHVFNPKDVNDPCNKYKEYKFYNKVFFILGLPLIVLIYLLQLLINKLSNNPRE